jgi:hypothetical protein
MTIIVPLQSPAANVPHLEPQCRYVGSPSALASPNGHKDAAIAPDDGDVHRLRGKDLRFNLNPRSLFLDLDF